MLVLLLLLEGPKLRRGVLRMFAARARRPGHAGSSGEVSRSVTGFMLGNFITSVIAGVVVFVTLIDPGRALRLAVGAVGGPVRLPAHDRRGAGRASRPASSRLTHSFGAFIVFAVVFLTYTQIENHVLNPIVMSRTVRINPLLVLIAILVGANIGDLVGGFFGGFVGTLLAIPVAGSIQVIVRELWQSTAPEAQLEVVGGRRDARTTVP